MRPTRIGREAPFRAGLIFAALGYDPTEQTEPPPDPVDRASQGEAFVPFLNPAGDPTIVQSATDSNFTTSVVNVTLGSTPTVGNILVLMACEDTDSGPTFTPNNGTWTLMGTVYSGNGTNWPNRMWYQVVPPAGLSATTTVTSSSGNGSAFLRAGIIELSGVNSLTDTGTASNTATTTDSVTPTASEPAALLSATFARTGSPPLLAPAGGMTEWAEFGAASPYGLNYQLESSATGSYTIGSTGAPVNSSMIGGAFSGSGDIVYWVPAPLTIDDDDATFHGVSEESITAAGGVFWRGTLADALLIASLNLRAGFQTAGANTITIQAGNEDDYSDAVTIDTVGFTATGSYTAQDITNSWQPLAVYRYWQLLITTDMDVTVYEVELLDPATSFDPSTLEHGELSGRDAADQHPADVVTVDDAGGYYAGTTVEAISQELASKQIGYQSHGNLGATETFSAATGWHSGTLNANCTFTLTGATTGLAASLFLELAQDGTGGWTITLPSSVANKTELEADQDTTASETTFLVLLTRDGGTTWYGGWWGSGGGSSVTPASTVEDETTFGITPAVGTDLEYARQDHTHGSPGDDELQAAGHYEVMMDGGSPPAALENGSGTDWLYVWVPG